MKTALKKQRAGRVKRLSMAGTLFEKSDITYHGKLTPLEIEAGRHLRMLSELAKCKRASEHKAIKFIVDKSAARLERLLIEASGNRDVKALRRHANFVKKWTGEWNPPIDNLRFQCVGLFMDAARTGYKPTLRHIAEIMRWTQPETDKRRREVYRVFKEIGKSAEIGLGLGDK